ncbi:hypothetical protein DPMN_148001 [Dreissena polymorpha]|uniref:Uncharacterized protein n=1 Tax=Dreissena polymorpha TaxID=45954 RepID=A0A9D4F8R7_DREPO|nr:hypothetical protein DPMN_148001 [Dreissena polymorpha]
MQAGKHHEDHQEGSKLYKIEDEVALLRLFNEKYEFGNNFNKHLTDAWLNTAGVIGKSISWWTTDIVVVHRDRGGPPRPRWFAVKYSVPIPKGDAFIGFYIGSGSSSVHRCISE